MSGGHWQYRADQIASLDGDDVTLSQRRRILQAAADTEYHMDRAICGDTSMEAGKKKVWQIWETCFDDLYGHIS